MEGGWWVCKRRLVRKRTSDDFTWRALVKVGIFTDNKENNQM